MSDPGDTFHKPWYAARTRYGEAQDADEKGIGRPRLFGSPEQLAMACHEYFLWVECNPLIAVEAKSSKEGVELVDVPKMRAMTMHGLYRFLDIDRGTWDLYKRRPEFITITSRVEDDIREQKFTGAAGGFLNANIIARDLGLADKREITGADGQPIKVVSGEMTPAEAAEAYAASLRGEG
jgi:hypothetical protein